MVLLTYMILYRTTMRFEPWAPDVPLMFFLRGPRVLFGYKGICMNDLSEFNFHNYMFRAMPTDSEVFHEDY